MAHSRCSNAHTGACPSHTRTKLGDHVVQVAEDVRPREARALECLGRHGRERELAVNATRELVSAVDDGMTEADLLVSPTSSAARHVLPTYLTELNVESLSPHSLDKIDAVVVQHFVSAAVDVHEHAGILKALPVLIVAWGKGR